jgi:NAD(P)-dependent dehydrogenase (short-subunit alcohol dehydrogenase family)
MDGVMEKFGSIDFLINTAGGYIGGKQIEDVTVEEWDGIMNLNLKATFLACRGALRVMREKHFGRIVNIAAMTALTPAARKGPYAVSKRGVITLTETIAEEVRGTGITANAIAPSTILTEANKQSMPKADVSKWVTPEEIARLILYLCSDEARSISGNVFKIYGGV